MDFKNSSVNDLLNKEEFRSWVKKPTPQMDFYWKSWLGEDQEKAERLALARRIILSVDFKKSKPGEIEDKQIFARIQQTIKENKERSIAPYQKTSRANPPAESTNGDSYGLSPQVSFSVTKKLAAVFIGFLLLGGLLFLLDKKASNQHSTTFGETKLIELPDRSVVKLNGNSTLKFAPQWNADSPREVWLEGEAYFSVRHTESDQKFVVYTSEQFNVEVLGTEFNVFNREEKTRVVLSSGKIKVNFKDESQTKDIMMKPGEMVEYSLENNGLSKKEVNPKNYTSWRNERLIFDDTSLKEIKAMLETTYGLTVEVSDESLLGKKIFGSAPSNNIEMLLEGLANSLDSEISLKNGHVKIEANRKKKMK